MRGGLFVAFSQDSILGQDEREAIRVIGGAEVRRSLQTRPKGCCWGQVIGGGLTETGKKMAKSYPGGNLLHCGKQQRHKSPPFLNSNWKLILPQANKSEREKTPNCTYFLWTRRKHS